MNGYEQAKANILALTGDQEACGRYDDGSWTVTRDGDTWTVTVSPAPVVGYLPCEPMQEAFDSAEAAVGAVGALGPIYW